MSLDLSVVIPTYDRVEQTRVAVASVLAEKIADEVIVVDDGSPKPLDLNQITSSEATNGETPVHLVHHETNRGPAAARNTGMKRSQKRWICFLDSDDELIPGTVAGRLAFAEKQRAGRDDALIACCCAWEERTAGSERVVIRKPMPPREPADFASGCWFNPGSCALFHRKAALEKVGLFDEGLRRLEDLDWFLRFGMASGTLVIDPVTGTKVNIGQRPDYHLVARTAQQMLDKWRKPEQPLPQDTARNLRAYLRLEMASSAWRSNRFPAAFYHLSHSLLLRPRAKLHFSPGWDVTVKEPA